MTRRKKQWLSVLLVAVLTAAAVWVVDDPQGRWPFRQGLDLQGGMHLVFEADVSEIPGDKVEISLAGVRDVIERRVNTFGVAEPSVVTNKVGDSFRIIAELPGILEVEDAIARIGKTPQLDFRLESLDEAVVDENADENIHDVAGQLGLNFERTDLSGRHLDSAVVGFDEITGSPRIELKFNNEGKELFATLTRENIGRRIGIFLDGVPIQMPVVQTEIPNGEALITGQYTIDEARTAVQALSAGALPVPINLVSQQLVGPSLGAKSVSQSMKAGLIGLGLVMVWMLIIYRLPGFVAALALAIYAVLFLAGIKLIPVTLTLAGIAGVILSIGMAVDANVLIFERFRENRKAGKNVLYAFEHGFEDAWRSIKTANISSLLIAVILYGFGTSIVRGFAVTFGLGILLSMFTAITVTRVLLLFAVSNKKLQKLC